MGSYYKPGCWNAICDVCGFEFKSDQLLKRWDGMMVCKQDFEVRHPQDFIRSRNEKTDVPWTRPESTDVFIPDPLCTLAGRSGIAGWAVAGCATPSTPNLGL